MTELTLAAVYQREVHATPVRIWGNVFDWEHLAHLHDGSFAACALLDGGNWGWRVALTPQGGVPQQIEMRADRAAGRYTSTTLAGKPEPVRRSTPAPHVTDVTVEFHLPETRPDRLAALGDAYRAAYAGLWDEDEAMMQARERTLAQPLAPDRGAPPLDLGDEPKVRASVRLAFDWGGAPFLLVALDGALIAHSTRCPHWLGPLDAAPVIAGEVRCPWHGYRFAVATGACASHPELKLAPAPVIRVDDGRVIAACA